MVFYGGWIDWNFPKLSDQPLCVWAEGGSARSPRVLFWKQFLRAKVYHQAAPKVLIYKTNSAARTTKHINLMEIADNSQTSFVLTSWRLIVTFWFPLCFLLTFNLRCWPRTYAFVLAVSGQRLLGVYALVRLQSFMDNDVDVPASVRSGPHSSTTMHSKSE